MHAQPDQEGVLPPGTPFCWPIRSLDELRTASLIIRSRVDAAITDPELQGLSVAAAVDHHLNTAHPGDSGARTPCDEQGRFVLFLHLLTPIARDRSRRLAALDNAAHKKPLLVSILLPELAFNLSEIESAYDFDIQVSLEEQFGEAATGHILMHNGSAYIDTAATFSLLSRHHPALLISLAYGVVFPPSDQTRQVRGLLHQLSDSLETIEGAIAEQLFTKELNVSPPHAQRAIIDLIAEAASSLSGIVAPMEGTDDLSWFPRHVIEQAFDSLLTDEKIVFDNLGKLLEDEMTAAERESANEDSTPPMSESEAMDIDGAQPTPAAPEPEDDMHSAVVWCLQKQERAIRRSRRRILALRRAIQ